MSSAEKHAEQTFTVRVEPLGVNIQCRRGEPLMRAALRAGYRWPTVCGGDARCAVCFVRVMASGGELSPITPKEAQGLKLIAPHRRGTDVRLACQLPVFNDMTVVRPGVVPPAASNSSGEHDD